MTDQSPIGETPLRVIGQEWIDHGYQSFQQRDAPEACIIDGTPQNLCTHETHEAFYGTTPTTEN